MRDARSLPRLCGLLLLLTGLPACQLTFREPRLEPLNTSRFYDAELGPTCDALAEMATQLGVPIESDRREDNACLIETGFRVFSDTGEDPTEKLEESAHTGVGGFIGGRYWLTLTGRDVRDGGTRVRATVRIEGYINEEFGYQVLRSRGVIEQRIFDGIGARLGATPVETN
jgi:hypothetical protein